MVKHTSSPSPNVQHMKKKKKKKKQSRTIGSNWKTMIANKSSNTSKSTPIKKSVPTKPVKKIDIGEPLSRKELILAAPPSLSSTDITKFQSSSVKFISTQQFPTLFKKLINVQYKGLHLDNAWRKKDNQKVCFAL